MRFITLVIAASCLLTALSAQADVLLVGNKSGHTLYALDLETGERRAAFETGLGPHEVEVSPNGRYAVVSNYGERGAPGNSLTVVDWPAGTVARVVDLGADTLPHGMAFLPDGRLVVTTEGSDHVVVVDIERGAAVQRIPIGAGVGHMVAASADGRFAWVTNISAGTLEKIDLATGEVVGAVRTGAGAEGVALARGDREVWVTNRADDTVTVVDAERLEILATLESSGFPIRAAITPDGRHALVTNARAATLSVFSIAGRELVATIQVADPDAEYQQTLLGRAALPIGIAIHPDGGRAYVAVSGGDEVAVIETDGWRIVDRWATGREPDALGVIAAQP
ncbi:MAG: YncE family protein [Gammaproteobacteria bacterium]